ncbi:MAG: hypothetical protein QG604_215 [Candidatus Dependentiae bacterium]|nr:hypothetical protein [Candidatus Dependentiae bacterium]
MIVYLCIEITIAKIGSKAKDSAIKSDAHCGERDVEVKIFLACFVVASWLSLPFSLEARTGTITAPTPAVSVLPARGTVVPVAPIVESIDTPSSFFASFDQGSVFAWPTDANQVKKAEAKMHKDVDQKFDKVLKGLGTTSYDSCRAYMKAVAAVGTAKTSAATANKAYVDARSGYFSKNSAMVASYSAAEAAAQNDTGKLPAFMAVLRKASLKNVWDAKQKYDGLLAGAEQNQNVLYAGLSKEVRGLLAAYNDKIGQIADAAVARNKVIAQAVAAGTAVSTPATLVVSTPDRVYTPPVPPTVS